MEGEQVKVYAILSLIKYEEVYICNLIIQVRVYVLVLMILRWFWWSLVYDDSELAQPVDSDICLLYLSCFPPSRVYKPNMYIEEEAAYTTLAQARSIKDNAHVHALFTGNCYITLQCPLYLYFLYSFYVDYKS